MTTPQKEQAARKNSRRKSMASGAISPVPKKPSKATRSASNPADIPLAPPSVSAGWPPFAQKLAAVLEMLEEDQFLVLSVKRSNQYIQFAAQGSFGMRVETTSNNYLARPQQLSKRQIAALIEAGWHAPSGTPVTATPDRDPDGSPNFYIDFPETQSHESVAEWSVKTLAEILRVPHPGMLEYEAFDADGNSLALAELGLRRTRHSQETGEIPSLPQRLLDTLREVTDIADLDFDPDGDIGIRYGNSVVFLRPMLNNPPTVRIFSRLLADIEETPKLLTRLNEFNIGASHFHLSVTHGAVFAVSDVIAAPFVSDHVAHAFQSFCEIADGITGQLLAEFGENSPYFEAMPSLLKH